ncbi:MAG: hypothetical protein ACXV5N_13705 [Halobacteriota archaeon]
MQVCSIFEGAPHTIGTSPGFPYLASVLDKIAAGREVGQILEQSSGIKRIDKRVVQSAIYQRDWSIVHTSQSSALLWSNPKNEW